MATKTIRIEDLPIFDVTDYLRDEECIAAFLADAAQETDPRWIAVALAHVARARERWGLPQPASPQ